MITVNRVMTIAFHTVLLWLWMRRLSFDHSQQGSGDTIWHRCAHLQPGLVKGIKFTDAPKTFINLFNSYIHQATGKSLSKQKVKGATVKPIQNVHSYHG